MIKGILFDLDGVLWDSVEANIKFFQTLLTENGYKHRPKSEVRKVLHMTMWDAIKFLTKEKSEKRIKEVWLSSHEAEKKYPVGLVKLPRGENKIIEILSKRYKLAIVTSSIREGVETFFKLSGFGKHFSAVVSFEDYKKPKPDPEPLLIAMKMLKVKSNETVYVGDSPTDMLAGKRAGCFVVGIITTHSKSELKGADKIIKNLNELIKLIK